MAMILSPHMVSVLTRDPSDISPTKKRPSLSRSRRAREREDSPPRSRPPPGHGKMPRRKRQLTLRGSCRGASAASRGAAFPSAGRKSRGLPGRSRAAKSSVRRGENSGGWKSARRRFSPRDLRRARVTNATSNAVPYGAVEPKIVRPKRGWRSGRAAESFTDLAPGTKPLKRMTFRFPPGRFPFRILIFRV